jgi:hypothetical protein
VGCVHGFRHHQVENEIMEASALHRSLGVLWSAKPALDSLSKSEPEPPRWFGEMAFAWELSLSISSKSKWWVPCLVNLRFCRVSVPTCSFIACHSLERAVSGDRPHSVSSLLVVIQLFLFFRLTACLPILGRLAVRYSESRTCCD